MMGQSLATRAVSGGTSSYSLSDDALAALQSGDISALIASHRPLFGGVTMLKEDEDDQDGDDGDDSGADDDGDDESGDEDDEDDDKSKSKESSRVKELSDENARWRVKYRNRGKRIADLETEIAELKKGKPAPKDEDDASGDDTASVELKTENEKLKEKLVTQSIRMEFNDLVTGSDALAKFKNPKTAFRLLDLSEVEIDEDGDITGLDDAIKALVKSDPYLLDSSKDEDDEDDEKSGPIGQPTGRKRGKGNPNRDKLLDKYPALRR